MKSFIRAKYGKPETRKELMQRLKNERADLETRKNLAEQVKSKNKDEFHFGFYSVNKNMVKTKKLKMEELKKALKYVDSEINRCENKIQSTMPFFRKQNLIFDSKVKSSSKEEPTVEELSIYIEQMKEKRKEIVEKIEENKQELVKNQRK